MTFAPGVTVHVHDRWPERSGPVHIRTPHYVRGQRGRIVEHLGNFPDPEELAFNRPAATRALYHVRFDLKDLWPDAEQGDLLVELFDHWLIEEGRS